MKARDFYDKRIKEEPTISSVQLMEEYAKHKMNAKEYLDTKKRYNEVIEWMEGYHQSKLKLLGIANVRDTLIAWEQFKKANWYESEAIDVEKKLMDKFQVIYGR